MALSLALKKPGIQPQSAPRATAVSSMQRNRTGVGSLSAILIMKKAVPMPPMSIWPSAPMFQKRILKAGARPMAMQANTAVSRSMNQTRFLVPKLPENMET